MSDLIVNTSEGIIQITQIQFGVLSSSDISKISSIECVNRELYDINKIPIPYGPVDYHLGVNQKNIICPTCNKKLENCPGHFGFIRLNLPIFHIGFFKPIIEILKIICKNCSRVILNNEERNKFRNSLSNKKTRLSSIQRKKIYKEIIKSCQKVKICPFCGSFNGDVKHITRLDPTNIVHEINKTEYENIQNINNNYSNSNFSQSKFDSAKILFSKKEFKKNNDNSKEIIFTSPNGNPNKYSIDLPSTFVYNLFKKIPDDDFIFLDMDGTNSSPIDLLLNYIIVPPLPIRPTIQTGLNSTNEDDLTIKIREMIHLNKYIKLSIEEGNGTTYKLIEDLNLLQSTHAYYINSDTKGINKNIIGNKQIRSLCTRLRGKHGRFRGHLSGKRVDFTGRTVISPDPNLQIDQVGVPVYMAKNLTYPERVTEFNINYLKKLILNGTDIHPGANFVITNNGDNKIYLGYTNKKKICDELKIGDIVERHLMNDDIILFNRQPSLHRLSIMAFHAKILPWRTLRFNESCCSPFNADFDGDEMNIHLPQTEEAKSEAINLMGVIENMQTPKNGEPLIASTQDFLTTFYLITQKDFFIDRCHFIRYCNYFNDALEKIDIPPPTIFKPKELWTGKQLFSLLLRPNKKSKVIINLQTKAKNYSRKYKVDEFKCPNDGFVVIKNSELLFGNIDKGTIGGSKNGIIFTLIKDCNKYICAKVLTRISKFAARWIRDYGMSFGISDVIPKKNLIENKTKLVSLAYKESDYQIDLYNKGQIQLKPGMNSEESLESALGGILSEVRNTVGKDLRGTLPKSNSALIMAVSGSKGSDINLCQMIACLGQQIVNGGRIPNGFSNRTLPHFEEFSKYPKAKGFISHSFYDGLDATEFFFHTMGGREGLVDTAVKTAATGYMQRRLMKALEDLTVQYNNIVTISSGEIIEFLYGDDGIDPINTDTDGKVICLERLWELIKSFYPLKKDFDDKKNGILNKQEIEKEVEEHIKNSPIRENEISYIFIEDVKNFFKEKIKFYDKITSSYSKYKNIKNALCNISKKQIDEFFRILWIRYQKAKISPGEAVGAVAGQSIGEPGTQMTLKTFHFAGVASMNITLGVPRIQEIINYSKNISTPVIYAKLIQENDVTAAKIVKGRIEKIKLKQIASYIKEVISSKGCYIKIKLDKKYMEEARLEITINQVKQSLLKNKKKLNNIKEQNILIISSDKMKIEPPESNRDTMYFSLENIRRNLPEIIISGIDTINRIVINKKEKSENSYILAIEGTGLLEIMKTPGIDYAHCTTNNINEIEKTLGIEAARNVIIYEINYTFMGYSIQVDKRHLGLIADLMTFKGTIHGFQRFGMANMKDSVLLHSSFERTTDILFDAAMHGKVDKLNGVSESIILGKMIPIGTGLFKVVYDKEKHDQRVNDVNFRKEFNGNKGFEDGVFFGKEVKFNLVDMIK